jgi:hypothetical protein
MANGIGNVEAQQEAPMHGSPNTQAPSCRPITEAVAGRLVEMLGSRTRRAPLSPHDASNRVSLAERLAPLIAGAILADARASDEL